MDNFLVDGFYFERIYLIHLGGNVHGSNPCDMKLRDRDFVLILDKVSI